MKSSNSSLMHNIFLPLFVFLIFVSNSACNVTNSVAMEGRDIMIDKLNNCNIPVGLYFNHDTIGNDLSNIDSLKNVDIIGDVIYDNLFK